VSDDRRQKVLEQVAALLAKADSTEFSEERDTFIAGADRLMAKYAIETFEIEMQRPKDERVGPELRTFEYGTTGNGEADEAMTRIFWELARHLRCLIGYYGWKHAKVVGYPADLDFLGMLFFSVRVHLSSRVEPHPDRQLSFGENVTMLKEAGLKWERIFQLLKPAFPVELDYPAFTKSVGLKMYGLYKSQVAKEGREQMYSNPDVWRRNFILGYSDEVTRRLQGQSRQNEQDSVGKGLVLVSMKDALQEALWDAFPDLRPHPKECDCDGCHAGRCSNIECTRSICVRMRKPVKYREPRKLTSLKYDGAAAAAGRAAGQSVDLTSSSQKVGATPSGEIN
jgi:hypothetical protein